MRKPKLSATHFSPEMQSLRHTRTTIEIRQSVTQGQDHLVSEPKKLFVPAVERKITSSRNASNSTSSILQRERTSYSRVVYASVVSNQSPILTEARPARSPRDVLYATNHIQHAFIKTSHRQITINELLKSANNQTMDPHLL